MCTGFQAKQHTTSHPEKLLGGKILKPNRTKLNKPFFFFISLHPLHTSHVCILEYWHFPGISHCVSKLLWIPHVVVHICLSVYVASKLVFMWNVEYMRHAFYNSCTTVAYQSYATWFIRLTKSVTSTLKPRLLCITLVSRFIVWCCSCWRNGREDSFLTTNLLPNH